MDNTMTVQGRLVEGVKEKFANEVRVTNILDLVQRKIWEYFDAIGSSLKNEFDNAKSLNFEIRQEAPSFLEIKIGDTGLEFIREPDSILVEEIIENGTDTRYYDKIHVPNETLVVTELYPTASFTSAVLDRYVEHIFKDYLK
jgi:hypothetical protein